MQIADPDGDNKESAVAAHWVTDGVDRCRVGFLGRHTIEHWKHKLWTFAARNRTVQQSARSSTKIVVIVVPLLLTPSSKKTTAVSVVTLADAHLCSTLTLHVYCLLRHVSTCVYMAYSYTSA